LNREFLISRIDRKRTVAEVFLQTDKHRFTFLPGDLLQLKPQEFDYRPNFFSVAKDYEDEIKIYVAPKGKVSRFLFEDAQKGDKLEGDFVSENTFHPTVPNSLCIATGTGVVPFLFAREQGIENALLWGIRYVENFPYCVGMDRCMVCLSEKNGQNAIGNTKAILKYGHVQSQLDNLKGTNLVYRDTKSVWDPDNYQRVYICGHRQMIEEVTALLVERGYPKERIESQQHFA
jgi:NAD(P)H-flavin reductase